MSTLDALVAEARVSYVASDPLDLVVREKRLTKLFTPSLGEEYLAELGAVLGRISTLLGSMPDPAGETKRRRELRDIFERGARDVPVGVVLIVASDDYPIASWAVPLAQVYADGNEAVLLTSPGALLTTCGNVRTWSISGEVAGLPAVDAVIGPRAALPEDVHVLPGGLDEDDPLPHELKRIAAQLKYLRDRAYVFVSSELSDQLAPQLNHRPHAYLAGPPQEVGVYTFSTLDRALEVAREVPAHATVIYAERAAAARAVAEYAARGGTARTTHINGYPAELALGPYAADCGFRRTAAVTVNQRPRHWCVSLIRSMSPRATNYKDIALREYRRGCEGCADFECEAFWGSWGSATESEDEEEEVQSSKDPRYWDYDTFGAGSWGMGWAFAV
ncbi:hypothetical protein A1Q2_08402 [Trichosporon asahii var. asahii CBS 8904]|uniref:Uncharacterized protein n=1 Tax=Trichosporon asahii var. asahii (strain CBS 8904) TaxID=1220162 RepID=K1VKM9_TRIAC|nr:hypothetical protein A1Q2_08402 [Trichosporon asahii var. asahii CBS 8904]